MTTEEAKPVVRRQFEDIVKSAGSDCGGQKFRKRLLGHGDDAPPSGGTERVAGNGPGESAADRFTGIVIWRIAGGKLAERWDYLESPHPVH
jgi:hypothetical protein